MKAKKFDCVEMKRRGADKIHEDTKDMTPREKLAYWRQRTRELSIRLQSLRRKPDAAGQR